MPLLALPVTHQDPAADSVSGQRDSAALWDSFHLCLRDPSWASPALLGPFLSSSLSHSPSAVGHPPGDPAPLCFFRETAHNWQFPS